jgi:hypothetical protein
MTETIISAPGRPPVVAQRRVDGAVALYACVTPIVLDRDELARLVSVAGMTTSAATSPAKARLLRYEIQQTSEQGDAP